MRTIWHIPFEYIDEKSTTIHRGAYGIIKQYYLLQQIHYSYIIYFGFIPYLFLALEPSIENRTINTIAPIIGIIAISKNHPLFPIS
jgi:hypothetical protein